MILSFLYNLILLVAVSSTVIQDKTYKITVYTADIKNAGTDAVVYMKLYGANGIASEEKQLDDIYKNNFERGTKDEITLQLHSLGPLQSVRIRHDNSGRAWRWFLEKITVEDVDNGILYEFQCNRWIYEIGDGQKLPQVLNVSNVSALKSTSMQPLFETTSITLSSAADVITTPANISQSNEQTSEECYCECKDNEQTKLYDHLSKEEFEMKMKEEEKKIRKELLVNKKNISSTIRKKISAPDERMTSKTAGYIAGIILALVFGFVVVSDVPIILQHGKMLKQNVCHSYQRVVEYVRRRI